MKILFQPVYLETPHFETELELIADHLDAGDEVFVLSCRGELSTCFANYDHEATQCRVCQARCAKGLGLLDRPVTVLPYPFEAQASYPGIPQTIATFAELRAFRIGPAQVGLAAAASLCTRFRTHRVDTIRHRKEVATELNTAYYVYLAFRRVLEDTRPDRVYLFNGRFSTVLPALNACEALGVPYVTHERGGTWDRYLLTAGTTPHDLAWARRDIDAAWSACAEDEATRCGARFFVDRRNRVEHCWYSSTSGQTVGHIPAHFDPSLRNIVIFNSTLEESTAVRGWPDTLGMYQDEPSALERICSACAGTPEIHIHLRVHPNLAGPDNAQMRELLELGARWKNLTVIEPDSPVDSYALLDRANVIVTFGSTMGVEACFWGKPSILIGRAFYESLDCVYKPETHDEVMALLRSDLPAKPRREALKYGFWDLTGGRPFKRYRPEDLRHGMFNGERVASVTI